MSRWAIADGGRFGVPLGCRTWASPTVTAGTWTARSMTAELPAPDSSETAPASGAAGPLRAASAEAAMRTTVAATVVRVGRFRPVRRIVQLSERGAAGGLRSTLCAARRCRIANLDGRWFCAEPSYADPVDLEFSGEVWFWRGPAPYHFVTVPEDESAELQETAALVTYGWGMIPVAAGIGSTDWTTSLWPKN